ncbi:hypothetical protein HN858_00185 [Candidatus Falkowbacteria bacterium]|jgi:hypothetical protein|nr:hypothetical protein [Candidatus Falkowbacteria bacterium]MBT6573523.1 hypothetical protein [Candidatus Falkowbacteria bacterium]MBT7348073.1 hypothetical protein [Candidatus Falkowbacteria bacterium]MBT7501092.1 hypothetical protein [Candidatus Falkowbacteria bacterium]
MTQVHLVNALVEGFDGDVDAIIEAISDPTKRGEVAILDGKEGPVIDDWNGVWVVRVDKFYYTRTQASHGAVCTFLKENDKRFQVYKNLQSAVEDFCERTARQNEFEAKKAARYEAQVSKLQAQDLLDFGPDNSVWTELSVLAGRDLAAWSPCTDPLDLPEASSIVFCEKVSSFEPAYMAALKRKDLDPLSWKDFLTFHRRYTHYKTIPFMGGMSLLMREFGQVKYAALILTRDIPAFKQVLAEQLVARHGDKVDPSTNPCKIEIKDTPYVTFLFQRAFFTPAGLLREQKKQSLTVSMSEIFESASDPSTDKDSTQPQQAHNPRGHGRNGWEG